MISISDHNEVFIAGGDDDKVHVYLNLGDNFVNDHALTDSSSDVNIADITGDGKWILSTDESRNIRIYKFDLKTHKYELYQTISSPSSVYGGTITDDHMWMVFAGYNDYVYIYTFNGN